MLLVEGTEDLKTIPYIMEANGIIWPEKPPKAPVWIEQYEDYSNLLKPEIPQTELLTNGLKALGMIIDSDENFDTRWKEIRKSCLHSIPDLPEQLPQAGMIHETTDGIRFGLWMMPDNISRGMLETFLSLMIPESNELIWQCAQDATSEAKKMELYLALHTEIKQTFILGWHGKSLQVNHCLMQSKIKFSILITKMHKTLLHGLRDSTIYS